MGTIDYTYDALNRLDTVQESGETLANYDYDAVGDLVKTVRADGTIETRGMVHTIDFTLILPEVQRSKD